MDPELWELIEAGDSDDEVAAILRLGQTGSAPDGVRIVTRFGEICTVRMPRGEILRVRESAECTSLKTAGALLGPDLEFEDGEATQISSPDAPQDERRPPELSVTGQGVVVGIVDWGFDFAHPDFRHADGSTRIIALWDQRGKYFPDSPLPYGYGRIHNRQEIDQALSAADPYVALGYHPADADAGNGAHGTHVTSIAAGNGGGGGPLGVAPEAELVLVHLSAWAGKEVRLGDSVTLLEAVDFISRTAGERPWVINLSMGRHGEQHDGTTLVEQGFDALLRGGAGRAICQSSGNYFQKEIHSSGQLRPGEHRHIRWKVAEADATPNQLEIWYSWHDRFEVELRSPDDDILAMATLGEKARVTLDGRQIGTLYHRTREPNTLDNHIVVFLYKDAPAGTWVVTLKGSDIIDGRFHAWIERDAACPACQSRFHPDDADPDSTTGSICNGMRTIAVGAYNAHQTEEPLAAFSSAGPTRDGRVKPDLCAPGVSILGARSAVRDPDERRLLTRMSGTSMAAPHVTGTVALMFEAAPRRLRIEETHNLLLSSARKIGFRERGPWREGSGYLDTAAAVEAARQVSSFGVRTETGSPSVVPYDRLKTETEESENDIAERMNLRHFILISGGPGPFVKGDPDHDQSWSNYVDPPLQLTNNQPDPNEAKRFARADETVTWLVYKPAYEARWISDVRSTEPSRIEAVKKVKSKSCGNATCGSYVDLIQHRAMQRKWKLIWFTHADEVWKHLSGLPKQSISRLWYWGHARDDLWLTFPPADHKIKVTSIAPGLRDRFVPGSANRVHRFIGCNTVTFAAKWAKTFGVWAEGIVGKVHFCAIQKTGGVPCLIDAAKVKIFKPDGHEDLTHLNRIRLPQCTPALCKDTPGEEVAFDDEMLYDESLSWPDDGPLETSDHEFYLSREHELHESTLEADVNLQEAEPACIDEEEEAHGDDENRGMSEQLNELELMELCVTWSRCNCGCRFTTPSRIFDELAHSVPNGCLATRFEIIARPGSRLGVNLESGDVLLRRGEGGLAHAALVASPRRWTREQVIEFGHNAESAADGQYVQVIEGGGQPHVIADCFARRIGSVEGYIPEHTLILRHREFVAARQGYLTADRFEDADDSTTGGELSSEAAEGDETSRASGPAIGPMHTGIIPPSRDLRVNVPDDAVISPLAITLRGLRKAPHRMRGAPLQIVVHCTSRGPFTKSKAGNYRKPAIAYALDHYLKRTEGFPHYVVDFNGTIYATCDERFIAHHAGWVHTGGRALFEKPTWVAPAWWLNVWSKYGFNRPTDLLPASANGPNSRSIGIELLVGPRLTLADAYTEQQYQSLARLILDIEKRHPEFSITSAPSRELVGHEDYSPVASDGGRANRGGGWDPGAHRTDPYFSWEKVWKIMREANFPAAVQQASRETSGSEKPAAANSGNSRPVLGAGLTPPAELTAYRRFRLTAYFIVDQKSVPTDGTPVPIYNENGQQLAEGSPAFFAQLSLNGSGRLSDGRLLNVTGKTVNVSHEDFAGVLEYHTRSYRKRPKPTLYSGIEVKNGRVVRALSFNEVPSSRCGIGYGSLRGIPLVPFRTLAADIGHVKYTKAEPKWKGKGGVVPPGTHVYIRQYDGLQLPDGTKHDGWFVVNDTGGGIYGAHFDVFVGTRSLYKQVKLPGVAEVWFPGIELRVPSGYTYGLET